MQEADDRKSMLEAMKTIAMEHVRKFGSMFHMNMILNGILNTAVN